MMDDEESRAVNSCCGGCLTLVFAALIVVGVIAVVTIIL